MKKILILEAETEHLLHAALDCALKHGGMAMLETINRLIQKVQLKAEAELNAAPASEAHED